MSLNGLNSDAVVQAHQAALAEAGGWYVAWAAGHGAVADSILTGSYSNMPIAIPWSCWKREMEVSMKRDVLLKATKRNLPCMVWSSIGEKRSS